MRPEKRREMLVLSKPESTLWRGTPCCLITVGCNILQRGEEQGGKEGRGGKVKGG